MENVVPEIAELSLHRIHLDSKSIGWFVYNGKFWNDNEDANLIAECNCFSNMNDVNLLLLGTEEKR